MSEHTEHNVTLVHHNNLYKGYMFKSQLLPGKLKNTNDTCLNHNYYKVKRSTCYTE